MFQCYLVDSRREGGVVEESDVVCAIEPGEIDTVATAALDVSAVQLPSRVEEGRAWLCEFTSDYLRQSIKETIHYVKDMDIVQVKLFKTEQKRHTRSVLYEMIF